MNNRTTPSNGVLCKDVNRNCIRYNSTIIPRVQVALWIKFWRRNQHHCSLRESGSFARSSLKLDKGPPSKWQSERVTCLGIFKIMLYNIQSAEKICQRIVKQLSLWILLLAWFCNDNLLDSPPVCYWISNYMFTFLCYFPPTPTQFFSHSTAKSSNTATPQWSLSSSWCSAWPPSLSASSLASSSLRPT